MFRYTTKQLFAVTLLVAMVPFAASRGMHFGGINGRNYLFLLAAVVSLGVGRLILFGEHCSRGYKVVIRLMAAAVLLVAIYPPMLLPEWQQFSAGRDREALLVMAEIKRDFPSLTVELRDPFRHRFRGLVHLRISGTLPNQSAVDAIEDRYAERILIDLKRVEVEK